MSPEQLIVVIEELHQRDLLVDEFDELFGSVSFDEVLTAANQK